MSVSNNILNIKYGRKTWLRCGDTHKVKEGGASRKLFAFWAFTE